MRILLHEAKKMFLHQNGLLFVSLFLILTVAAVVLFDKPENADMELYSAQYHHYLEEVEGKLTPKSEAFLQAEAKKLSAAQIALDGIYEDFYNGTLSKIELLQKAAPLEAILQNAKGFDLVYEQFTYLRENGENRFFLDTNGWNGLLSEESLDFLLLLTLLLLVTPVFCHEAAGRMDCLILTQKKGARYTAVCKIALVLGLTALLCLFVFGIRYLFYSRVYGLENGSFPLQSLSYFGTSTKKLSLAQAFVCISACKALGFAAFSMLIMAVSVLVKKYPLALFSCTAVILLPYLGQGAGSGSYVLPSPLGFMLATGFFKGSESRLDPYTGQMAARFEFMEISSPLFWGLLALLLVLCMILWVMITHRYTNVWRTKTHRCIRKPVALLLICTLVCNLAGCSPRGSDSNSGCYDIYNMTDGAVFENDNFRFSVGNGIQTTELVYEDKLTGKTDSLIKNPLHSMTEIGHALYGNGELVYYIKYNIDKSGPKQQLDRFSIIEMNTTSFNEKIIFEKNISESEEGILGKRSNSSDNRFFAVYAFFLDSRNIFIVCDGEIMQINRITGKTTLIPITEKGNIAYDGRHLYYINKSYQMIKHDTRNDSKVVFANAILEHFYLTETEILYRNRQDNDKIYGMSLDGETVYKLSDKSVLSVKGDETYLYFTDKEDLKDYRMDRAGGTVVLIEDMS